jgi:SAM-dependent methyltransferase
MPKGDSYLLKNGFIHRVIEPRILYHDRSWGNTYQERTKSISAHFKSRYTSLKEEFETPDYFRDQLIRNYILKGPMLEWYTRIKTRMEGNYRFFHEHLPTEGIIVDIGCGYGYLAHILAWTSNKREVIGFDHDEEKLAVASNTPVRTPNLRFEKHNLLTDYVPPADAYVLADVLHYLPESDQQRVIKQCIAQLNRGGVLLIRDADAELRERQKGTWLTEFISTNLGFNKMNSNKLCFVSRAFVEKTVSDSGASVKVFDRSRFTSNVVYLIQKPVD